MHLSCSGNVRLHHVNVLAWCRIWLLVMSCVFGGVASAQVNPEISSCAELKDEATKLQADLCSAHAGCKLVMGIQSACAKVKSFLNRLGAVRSAEDPQPTKAEPAPASSSPFGALLGVLDKVKSALTGEKPVTANQVFEASLTEQQKRVQENDADWKNKSEEIRSTVRSRKESVVSSAGEIYAGEVDGRGVASGWGVKMQSNGTLYRGQFQDGNPYGEVDALRPDGERAIGSVGAFSQLQGKGLVLTSDGSQYRGNFSAGRLDGPGGEERRPDGTVVRRGTFQAGHLHVGQVLNPDGSVQAEVDKPREARLAEEARVKAESEARRLAEQERAANEERKRALAAQQAQEYQQKLANMSVGELFAYADELKAAKQEAKAREVRRLLVARFPDHALALQTAQQMAAESTPTVGAAANGAVDGVRGGVSSPSGASVAMRCGDSLEGYLQTLPNFQSAALRDVVANVRNDSKLLQQQQQQGRITAAYLPEYERMQREFERSAQQALSNHQQISGPPNRAMCNPPNGSQAMAWAAATMGAAFAKWGANTVRCAIGQGGASPLPAFCPY